MSIKETGNTGFNQLVSFMRKSVEKEWIPGFSAAILTAETTKIITEGKQAIWPKEEQLRNDAIYDVASLTKVMVTTTLILQFAEEQKLSLEDPVQNYLPAFIHPDVLIVDLLLHRSGLPSDIKLNPNWTKEEYKQTLMQSPIDHWGETLYSDIGFILLGWVLEAVARCSLLELSHERIIRPLHLQDSGYNLKRPLERFVPTELRETGLKRGKVHDRKATYLNGVSGHAGWFATIEDSARFLRTLLERDSSCEVFPAMYVDWILNYTEGTRTLGWEWQKSLNGDQYLYHTGFTGVFLYINLSKELGSVFLTNSIHPNRENPYKENRDAIIQHLFLEGAI